VFGGFAAKELAARIDDATPKLILAASCGIEPGRIVEYKPLLDAAIDLAQHKPEACLVFQRPQAEARLVAGRDHDWAHVLAAAKVGEKRAPCVEVAATDPLYILYTSGTTGAPKGVVRDSGGYMVALKWSMANLYGLSPGETFWTASDIGWVVGHSYIVYAPLLHGCTSVLYEGKPIGTPDAGAFWRVIEEHRVAAFFTAPTAFRAVRKEDPEGALLKKYSTASLRTLFLAGERADPETPGPGAC
jgi:propionyl-CoA synthetase